MAKTKILVIDDDPVTRSALRSLLEAAGYSMEEAHGGSMGLETLRKSFGEGRHFDIVICDYMMPDLDGLSCLTQAYREGILGDLPILMLTTEKVGSNLPTVKELKIAAWIIKPIDPNRILSGLSLVLSTDRQAFARS